MSRHVAIGLAAVVLAACQPSAEPAAPATPAEPVETAALTLPAGEDAAWTAEQDRYLHVNVAPSDPLEAVMWRGVRCDFLGSEFGGDNSSQDQAINARMDELRCGDELLEEARALRAARAADPAVVSRIDALIARWGG